MSTNNHRRKYWLIKREGTPTILVYNLVKWCSANDYNIQKLYEMHRSKIRTYQDVISIKALNQHEYAAFATGNQQRDRCNFINDPTALDSLVEGERKESHDGCISITVCDSN